MYRAYGLLQPGTDFTLGEAQKRLAAQFPNYSVTSTGEQITVSTGDWEMELRVNAEPYVVTESAGFAEKIAGLEDGAALEVCDRRVEVWSDTPDPFVEHLSDFHAVIEVLRTFRGLIPIDPREPALM